MRILLFILTMLCTFTVHAQNFPNQLPKGNSSVEEYQVGAIGTNTGIHFRRNYVDTAEANAAAYVSTIPNIEIIVGGRLIKRNSTATKWEYVMQSLSDVTKFGNRTDTNVLVKSINTNGIFTDTTHEPDYEIIVWPDIQGMTYFNPAKLYTMSNWVRDNKTAKNIKAVLGLGDITDNSETYEWPRADSAFDTVDSTGLPYLPTIGNHDYDGGDFDTMRLTTEYNTWFGPSRYSGKTWYGGNFHGKSDNSYIKFNVGSTKYLVVALEMFAPDSSLAWADRVVDSFPDYKAIITTHAYVSSYGERATDTTFLGTKTYNDTKDNSGQEMWDKFVKNHANIFMILNGHYINNISGDHAYSSSVPDVGVNGNVVQQIFVNYQRKGNGGGWNNAGDGYFMRLRFSPTNGKAYVSYYSSVYNAFDPAMDSFNIDVPNVQLNSSLSVKRDIFVERDVKVTGKLYTSIPRYSIPIIGINGQLKDTTGFNLIKNILNVPNVSIGSMGTAGQIPYVGSGDFRLRGSPKLYYDSTSGSIGVGTTSPLVPFHITDGNGIYAPFALYTQSISATNAGDVGISMSNASSVFDSRPVILGQRSRGTQTTPLAVADGDWIFGLVSGGFDGTSRKTTAAIEFIADGAVSTNVMPQKIDFLTGTTTSRATRMTIKANGAVGINTTTPLTPLHLNDGLGTFSTFALYDFHISSSANSDNGISIGGANSTAGNRPLILFERARGSQTAPTTVADNDAIGAIVSGGYDGTARRTTASIDFEADGTVSTSVMPQRIVFKTGLTNSRSTRMVLKASGSLVLGGTVPDVSALYDIQSTTKGLLIPRMTTAQMTAITSPATGLMLRNTDAGTEYAYNGSAYKSVGTISGSHDCGACAPVGTITVTVTFGGTQPNATYKVLITPTDVGMAVPYYVTNKTTTTFDVTFISPTGTGEKFDWAIYQ